MPTRRLHPGLLILIASSCALTGMRCGNPQSFTPPAYFHQRWMHLHEEDSSPIQAYRPHGYRFPPSRGREGFEARADGIFIHYAIAPADGTEQREGSWKMAGDSLISVSLPDGESYTIRIVRLDSTQLQIIKDFSIRR